MQNTYIFKQRLPADELAKTKWIKSVSKTPVSMLKELIIRYDTWIQGTGPRASLAGLLPWEEEEERYVEELFETILHTRTWTGCSAPKMSGNHGHLTHFVCTHRASGILSKPNHPTPIMILAPMTRPIRLSDRLHLLRCPSVSSLVTMEPTTLNLFGSQLFPVEELGTRPVRLLCRLHHLLLGTGTQRNVVALKRRPQRMS